MRLFILLAVAISLCAQEFPSTITTENDPSTLVEGVSVITGDLYMVEEDYVVQGAKPISFHRSYLSRDGRIFTSQHLEACFLTDVNLFQVREPNGTTIIYYPDPTNKARPYIGDNFLGETGGSLRYNAFSQGDKGISNTKAGQISAQTNLKNQYLTIGSANKGKSIIVCASNGTVREYEGLKDQQKTKPPGRNEYYLQYNYRLKKETFPNGQITHYLWDDTYHQVRQIYTTNLRQNKTFTSLDIPVGRSLKQAVLTGSDQRSLTFQFLTTEIKNSFCIDYVISPDFPHMQMGWNIKEIWSSAGKEKVPFLHALAFPLGRQMNIGYQDFEDPTVRNRIIRERIADLDIQYNLTTCKKKKKELKRQKVAIKKDGLPNEKFPTENLVKTLSAPVGPGQELITTHTFVYDKPNKNSYVLDAQGNKTAYFWNDDYRLTQIFYYQGFDQFDHIERFTWEGTNLKCKALLDKDSNPIFARTYQYDPWGNVIQETFYGYLSGEDSPDLKIGSNGLPEDNGIETSIKKATYSQDSRHLVKQQDEPGSGLCVKYDYVDSTHLLRSKSIGDQQKEHIHHTYEYDADLLLTKETTRDEISHTWKKLTLRQKDPYIGMPQIIEEGCEENTLLRKTVLHYGPGATIDHKDIYDANDQFVCTLTMTYDDKGRLRTETNALGQEAEYRYDEVGNRIYAKDFTGRLETLYTYDCSNRLRIKEEKGDDGVHRFYYYTYDTKHNLITETDPYGNTTTYTPDSFGRRKETHLPPLFNENGDSLSSTTTFIYDSAGNPIFKTDPAGHTTQTAYNAYGKPIQIIHPDGATESFTYYPNGLLKTSLDAKQVATHYEYDYLGRILRKQRVNAIETYEYVGQYLKKKIDPEGNVTLYDYDLAGRKIEEDYAGEKTIYTYDARGRLRTTRKGNLTTITDYDPLDRILEERDESSSQEVFRKIRYEYDSIGKRKTIFRSINGREEAEILEYDSVNRLIRKTDALGFAETYEYSDTINQKTHTDPNGLQTIETYNAQNLLSSLEKRKEGKTLSLQEKYYDPNGHLSLQIDTVYAPGKHPRKIRTSWEYDNRGRLKTLIEAEGTVNAKITRYTYTLLGQLETVTKPSGIILTYGYNELGHLTSLVSSDRTVNHWMTYNLLGHLQTSDQFVRTTDPFGRLLSETFSQGYTLENTYDRATGRRTACKIPRIDCLITYEYDAAHLRMVTRSKLDQSEAYSHAYTSYDLSGNLTSQGLIHNQGTLEYTIDPLSRKSGITAPHFMQKVLNYDGLGNITRMSIHDDVLNYTYDDLYQLTSETGPLAHTYLYDSLSNRLAKDDESYEINPLNQIASLAYDKSGNLDHYGNTQFTYDALDRLIRLKSPSCTRTYTYDFLNRCLSTDATYWFSSEKLYFLYDGQNEIGALDASFRPQNLRILGSAPHAEIGAAIAIELDGQVHVPIHDLQGNLAALWSPNQDPTLYRYSAFGEEKISGYSVSPWRFSSKRTDDALVNFGRRYYFPILGRWLTPDPAGFTDGMNLYAYLHNDPLTHFDEYGLIMTARDYQTTVQIARAPWETERPWNTASYYTRNLASSMAHDLYSHFYEPLRDLRFLNPESTAGSIDRDIWNEKLAIDRLFGTDLAMRRHMRDQYYADGGMQYGVLPCPGNLFGTASKVSQYGVKACQNLRTVYNSSRKLVFPAKEYVSPHATLPIKGNSISQELVLSRGTENINSASALRSKLSGLQKAQGSAVRIHNLPDGRIRYYTLEVPASKQGLTRGTSYVTELNPNTGQVRSWMENYDHFDRVNRVHPKMINGQTVNSIHYPPIGSEIMGK